MHRVVLDLDRCLWLPVSGSSLSLLASRKYFSSVLLRALGATDTGTRLHQACSPVNRNKHVCVEKCPIDHEARGRGRGRGAGAPISAQESRQLSFRGEAEANRTTNAQALSGADLNRTATCTKTGQSSKPRTARE